MTSTIVGVGVGIAIAVVIAGICGGARLMSIPGSFLLMFLTALGVTRNWSTRGDSLPWPMKLPDPELFSDLDARSAMHRLIGGRAALRQAIRDSPPGPPFDLSPVRTNLAKLERRIEVLLARIEYIGGALPNGLPRHDAVVATLTTDSEIEELRAREHAGLSENARAAYRASLSEHKSCLETVAALQAKREELLATVDHLLTVIESLPTRIAYLQHTRHSGCHEASPESVAHAAKVADRLSAFVEAAYAPTTPQRSADVGATGGWLSDR